MKNLVMALVMSVLAIGSVAEAKKLTAPQAKQVVVKELKSKQGKYFGEGSADLNLAELLNPQAQYYFARWQSQSGSYDDQSKISDSILEQLNQNQSPVDFLIKNSVRFEDLLQKDSYAAFKVLTSPNVYIVTVNVEHCSQFEFSFAVSAVTGAILEVGSNISPSEQ